MQILSNDKMIRSNTVQDSKDFNPQSSTTKAKKSKHLVSMMPAIEKALDIVGEDIVESSTDNESLKRRFFGGKWLKESKTRPLRQLENSKTANFSMSRIQKQMKKP